MNWAGIADDEVDAIDGCGLGAFSLTEALARLRTRRGAYEYRHAVGVLCNAMPQLVLKAALNATAKTTTNVQPTLANVSDGRLKDLVDKLFTEALRPYQRLEEVRAMVLPLVLQHHEHLATPPVPPLFLTAEEREFLRQSTLANTPVVGDSTGASMRTAVLTKLDATR